MLVTNTNDAQTGIVLAMFGTSVEDALPGLLNIRARMVAAFAGTPVAMAFTSKIIRRIWRDRAADPGYRAAHPEISGDLFNIRDPETVVAGLREQGFASVVVQPVHIAPAGNDTDLDWYIAPSSAKSMRIAYGRPALGTRGAASGREDIAEVVRAIVEDFETARRQGAALCYLGHGNRESSTERAYGELAEMMRQQYPDVPAVMSLLEAGPSFAGIIAELKARGVKRVLLKPFMIVAGDHVRKDMAGDAPACLKNRLEEQGFTVAPIFKGLGEDDAFADIFVRRAADAARDAGIELR